jgi:hypothetical protein
MADSAVFGSSMIPKTPLRASRRVLDELRDSILVDSEEATEGVRGIAIYVRGGPEMYGTLNPVSRGREQEAEVWTGRLYGTGLAAGGILGLQQEMTFVLERYGSPDIATLLVVIFLLIYQDRRADTLDDVCYRRAIEICGEGNIKRVRTARALISLSPPGGLGHECDIECM